MPGSQRPYRPYFYNFLTAFRAHHAFRSAAAASSSHTPTTAAAFAAQQQPSQPQQSSSSYSTTAATTASSSSAPWPIPHKSAPASHNPLSPTSGVTAAFSPPGAHHRHTHTATAAAAAAATAATSHTGAGSSGGFGANGGNSGPRTGRRGSDASSDSGGFRERAGGEAWLVGGKTAAGEERFYRLGMTRRERSGERASVDQMSL